MSIGEVDGPGEYVLTNVLSGTVLSDGTIVVQNSTGGLFEIRYYDDEGRHLATASRWGEGPYEFERAYGVFPTDGDSVRVVGSDGRFAVFGPRGERVREGRLALEPLLPTLLAGPVDPLRWVSIDQVGGMPEPGLGSQPLRVLRLDLERGVTDTLETGRGPPTLVAALPDRPGIYWVVMPFASRTLVGAGAGMVWIGHSSTGEIRGYRGGSETPDAVAQLPTSAPAVARADRVRAREAYARRYSSEYWARHARLAEAVEPPDRMPMFDHVSVDRLGMLWVARYWPPWSESEQSWAVFSPEGEHVADVSVPARAVPDCFRRVASGCTPLGGRGGFLDVGVDYVLLTQRDELGVVRVRRHSLMRSQR